MGNCSASTPKAKYANTEAAAKETGSTTVEVSTAIHDGPILGLCHPEHNLAVSCGDDRRIAIINVEELLSSGSYSPNYLSGHTKAVNRVQCYGPHVWSCSRDLSLRMWDRNSLECLQRFDNAHELNIMAITQSKFDTMTIISGSRDYHVKCWDLESRQCKAQYSTPRNIVTTIEPSPTQASILYQGSEDLFIRVWDTRVASSTTPVQVVAGFVYFPVCMNVHPEGHLLATGCKGFDSVGCTVKVWDMRNTAQPVREYAGHSQDVVGCAFSQQNSDLLVSTSKDGSVKVWDTTQPSEAAGACYAQIAHTGRLNSCLAVPPPLLPDMSLYKPGGQVTSELERTTKNPQLLGNNVAVGGMDGSITFASISGDRKSGAKGRLSAYCTTAGTSNGGDEDN